MISLKSLIEYVITYIRDFTDSFIVNCKYRTLDNINLGLPIMTVQGDIKVFVSDEAVILGGMPRRLMGAITVKESYEYYVIINKELNDAHEWIRDAVIWHELGHIHHNHFSVNIDKKRIVSNLATEIEADRYSQDNGFEMYKTLLHMQAIGYEVDNRIKKMKEYLNIPEL